MTKTFLLFFSVFFTVWGVLNYCLYLAVRHLFPSGVFRIALIVAIVFLAIAYPLGRIIERTRFHELALFSTVTGSIYFGFVIYALVSSLFVFSAMHLFRYFSGSFPVTQQLASMFVVIVSVLFCIIGYINSFNFNKVSISISSQKAGPDKPLKILYLSDIHLGHLVGKNKTNRIADVFREESPDIVLLGGDTIDDNSAVVERDDLLSVFREMKPQYGVYAIPGNHEYIGGYPAAERLLSSNGITVLRDNAVSIASFITVAGRDDISVHRFTGKKRLPLKSMLPDDRSRFIILMDHQPHNLKEALYSEVDLQLSGHTHHGQMWPLNLLTEQLFEISAGYAIREKTHYYVSSGFGTWGPPLKLFRSPEYVIITVSFNALANGGMR